MLGLSCLCGSWCFASLVYPKNSFSDDNSPIHEEHYRLNLNNELNPNKSRYMRTTIDATDPGTSNMTDPSSGDARDRSACLSNRIFSDGSECDATRHASKHPYRVPPHKLIGATNCLLKPLRKNNPLKHAGTIPSICAAGVATVASCVQPTTWWNWYVLFVAVHLAYPSANHRIFETGPMMSSGPHPQVPLTQAQIAQQQQVQAHASELAKRRSRKPTDKNVPDGVEDSIVNPDAVQRYKDLRDVERRLDAIMTRKRLDIVDNASRSTKVCQALVCSFPPRLRC